MATKQNIPYAPDYAVPPGETLLETLEAVGMTQSELAERTGRPHKTINEIVRGKAAITAETALQLERVLGVPATIWDSLERNYRAALAAAEDRRRLADETDWLREIPTTELTKRGHLASGLEGGALVGEALRFFGVASIAAWRQVWQQPVAAFRQSPAFSSNGGALAAWLRIGELTAQQRSCSPFDQGKLKSMLPALRTMTKLAPAEFQPAIERACADVGVALVFVPELSGCRVCGATRWLSPQKALVQLSLRYKSNDQLWFSIFHEIGHVLLHGKRQQFVDFEHTTGEQEQEQEAEANQFAADTIIPPQPYQQFIARATFSPAMVRAFASQIGVAPGVVVGRLQHDGHLPWNQLDSLKVRLAWKT